MRALFLLILTSMSLSVLAGEGHAHDEIGLNHGSKWIANEATQQGITAIDKLLDQAAEYETEALFGKMQQELQTIIAKCDMQGEAHDQLHKVLHPIIGQVEKLERASDEERPKVLAELKRLTGVYFAHFETAAAQD